MVMVGAEYNGFDGKFFGEEESIPEVVISECAGIVKTYEAVTGYCGFSFIEAGKTMGLFPHGTHNPNRVSPLFTEHPTSPIQ